MNTFRDPIDRNYQMLPEHMQSGARLYVEDGVEPGSFLTYVLCNDFKSLCLSADDINIRCLSKWGTWVLDYCPAEAQGSHRTVEEWVETGGLKGAMEDDD